MGLERALYTAAGAFASVVPFEQESSDLTPKYALGDKPHIVFSFWDVPSEKKTGSLFVELKRKFEGNGLPIGVGLFTRPMGDVHEVDNRYNPEKLQRFLDVCVNTNMPVFINTSGMHWTDVAYQRSSLIHMLEQNPKNLLYYTDGTRVQRKVQPPGNILKGLFGSDRNGVVYFSPFASEVNDYHSRNLFDMAQTMRAFQEDNPQLYLGTSTPNEIDVPGNWITGGKSIDWSQSHGSVERIVYEQVSQSVAILTEAGLTNIYTNQSLEDGVARGSTLHTADVAGSNIGITAWKTGNEQLFAVTEDLARKKNKNWALAITNPLSLDVNTNIQALQAALRHNPTFIGIYNWWPHFWGYGVRGMPLEAAIKVFTK